MKILLTFLVTAFLVTSVSAQDDPLVSRFQYPTSDAITCPCVPADGVFNVGQTYWASQRQDVYHIVRLLVVEVLDFGQGVHVVVGQYLRYGGHPDAEGAFTAFLVEPGVPTYETWYVE